MNRLGLAGLDVHHDLEKPFGLGVMAARFMWLPEALNAACEDVELALSTLKRRSQLVH